LCPGGPASGFKQPNRQLPIPCASALRLSVQSLKREHGGLPLQFRRNNFSFAIKRYLLRNGVARTQQTGRETQQVRNAAHPMPISEACSA